MVAGSTEARRTEPRSGGSYPLFLESLTPERQRALRDLLAQVYARAYAALPEYAYTEEKAIHRYLTWLARRTMRGGFFVAFSSRGPVGFLAADPAWRDEETGETIGEIHEFVVDPAYQGGGVGRSLFSAGLAYLRDAGHAKVGLWVGVHNDRAKAFYAKNGFVPGAVQGKWLRMYRREPDAVLPNAHLVAVPAQGEV
ncbi:MAG: GNAT family N-acetyltransferase [Brockia lithotrophica]|nr:GNAT family N-acetyltransferase [Brockia lithotrophica]